MELPSGFLSEDLYSLGAASRGAPPKWEVPAPAGVAGPLRYPVRAVICGFAAHRPMDAEPLEALTDAIYRAALEPQAWDEVMGLMSICFPSTAQAFSFSIWRLRACVRCR